MDSLPSELLSHIFAYACTDGGSTGARLSAVSRRVRAHAHRHALQTVALQSWRQIVAFSALLDTRARAREAGAAGEQEQELEQELETEQECCVYHLYMTDRPSAWLAHVYYDDADADPDPESQATSESQPECTKASLSPNSESESESDRMDSANANANANAKLASGTARDVEHAYRILTRVGHTLRTLALLLFDDHATPSAHALSFPLLAELTVHSSFFRAVGLAADPTDKPGSYEAAQARLALSSAVPGEGRTGTGTGTGTTTGTTTTTSATKTKTETKTKRGPAIPTLRKLHVVQNVAFGYDFVREVATLAPALAHLRLSELSCAMFQNGDLVRSGVAELVVRGGANAEDTTTSADPGCHFPATLERLVLQFHNEDAKISPQWSSSAPSSAYHAVYVQTQSKSMLTALCRHIQHDAKKRVVVLRPYAFTGARMRRHWYSLPDAPHYADIAWSWKARSGGDEGFWEWPIDEADVLLAYGYPSNGPGGSGGEGKSYQPRAAS